LSCTFYNLGDFQSARRYARYGVQIWGSGGVQSHSEGIRTPIVSCLCYQSMSEWALGEVISCQENLAKAISLAKDLNDMSALAQALTWALAFGCAERNPGQVDRLASDLIELSTRQNFLHWLAIGTIHRGWALSASGDTVEGIPWIEKGIREYRATDSVLALPSFLGLKAEALYLTDRTSEALEVINEALALAERFEHRNVFSGLHRLCGVFLAALGANETQIEASLCQAIRIAKEQESVSMAKRAEGTYTEYLRQRASASGGCAFRLPL